MKKFLPSKKFLSLMALLISIGGLALLIGSLVGNKTQFTKEKSNTDGSLIVVKDLVEKDTDSDGVPDWKEQLWGTDPSKTITFGTVSDYDYIHQKETLLASTQTGTSAGQGTEPTTTTDAFARDVVTLVSALNASGQLTPENQNAVVSQIETYVQNHPQSKEYTISDIQLTTENKTSQITYGSQITKIISSNPITEDDFDITSKYQENIEKNEFTSYIILERKYEIMISQLLKTPVPSGELYMHLDLLNALQGLADTYKGLSLYNSDPLLSFIAYTQAREKIEAFRVASSQLANYFEKMTN